jgi:hypothetical protein
VKVVVVTVSRSGYRKATEDALRRWAAAGDSVSVIMLRPKDPAPWDAASTVDLGSPTTMKRLGRAGTAICRVWPGSVNRQLASRVRRSPQAKALLADADLVCGVEPVTTRTLYRSSRRNPDAPHVLGVEPALNYFQR